MDKIKFLFNSIIPFFIESTVIIKLFIIIWVVLLTFLLIKFFSFHFLKENSEIGISIKYEKYTPEKHQIFFSGLFNNKKLTDLNKKGFLVIGVKNNTKQKILEDINLRIKSKFLIYDVAQLYEEEDKSKQLINYGKFKNLGSGTIGIVTSGADLKIDRLAPSSENGARFYILVEKINGTQNDDLDNAILFDGWYKSNIDGKTNDRHFKRLVNVLELKN